MANVITYLEEYGKYSFKDISFNNVDNLILSRLVSLPYKLLPNSIGAYDLKMYLNNDSSDYKESKLNDNDKRLMQLINSSERFKDVVCYYHIKEQFQSLTFLITGNYYIYYADMASIINDFQESKIIFDDIANYWNKALQHFEDVSLKTNGNLYVGGYLKGGSIALYVAIMCNSNTKSRIVKIYVNDGGYFINNELIQKISLFNSMIVGFTPYYSIIGRLFSMVNYKVVDNNDLLIFTDDIYSWKVFNNDFIYHKKLSVQNKRQVHEICNSFLNMSKEEMIYVINKIHDVIVDTNIKLVSELNMSWFLKNIENKIFYNDIVKLVIRFLVNCS